MSNKKNKWNEYQYEENNVHGVHAYIRDDDMKSLTFIMAVEKVDIFTKGKHCIIT